MNVKIKLFSKIQPVSLKLSIRLNKWIQFHFSNDMCNDKNVVYGFTCKMSRFKYEKNIYRNTIIMCYCLDLPKEIERDKEMNTHVQISTH